MGVVYSPEEVENGYVAQLGDHFRLGKALLTFAEETPSIAAAMVYGSTASGNVSIRSDVDILFIGDIADRDDALDALKEFKSRAFLSGNYARAEDHFEPTRPFTRDGQFDRQYLDHFRRVQAMYPDWTFGQPLDYLPKDPPRKEELIRDAITFVGGKQGKFSDEYTNTEVVFKVYQRALELPVAISRKMQQVMPFIIDELQPTEDKEAMRSVGLKILRSFSAAGFSPAAEAEVFHNSLVALDIDYSVELTRVLKTKDYAMYRERLMEKRDVVYKTARRLASSWQQVLDIM